MHFLQALFSKAYSTGALLDAYCIIWHLVLFGVFSCLFKWVSWSNLTHILVNKSAFSLYVLRMCCFIQLTPADLEQLFSSIGLKRIGERLLPSWMDSVMEMNGVAQLYHVTNKALGKKGGVKVLVVGISRTTWARQGRLRDYWTTDEARSWMFTSKTDSEGELRKYGKDVLMKMSRVNENGKRQRRELMDALCMIYRKECSNAISLTEAVWNIESSFLAWSFCPIKPNKRL